MVDDYAKTSLCSSKSRWRNHITMCTPICSALQLFLPNGQKIMRTWWQINRIYLLKTTKMVLLAPKAWEEVISASCLWLRRCKPRFSLSSSPSVRYPRHQHLPGTPSWLQVEFKRQDSYDWAALQQEVQCWWSIADWHREMPDRRYRIKVHI